MSKLACACAVVVAVATSIAGGIAAAQIQSGVARKAAPPSVALGVPVANANANASQRSSSNATAGSGSSLSFASGQPALRYLPDDLPTAKDPVRREAVKDDAKDAGAAARGAAPAGNTSEFAPAPGVLRANMPPVSFADAERILKARVLPANLNQGVTAAPKTSTTSASTSTSVMKISGDANALGPASIAELARSLRHHPDLIYQYVRNNIEYYPVFGSQKGALGAVLDNQATAHDQATLMVELLRASGVEANYVRGIAKLSAAQLAEWWGVSTANACGVLSLLGQAQIPVYEINATSAGSCPGTVAALTDVSIEHVWVKARINGSWFVFDPSYKPHTFKSGIDLASAAGYSAANHMDSALSGATVGTDYVQSINRTNIRFNLEKYAGILAGYLPSSQTVRTSASNSVVTTSTYNAANKYVPQTSTVDAGAGKVTLGNGTTIERGYDAQGALVNLNNFLASASQEVRYTYTRNQLRELKSVSWTNNLYQWSGAAPGTKSYTANGLNQYTAAGGAAMGYDANGNLTGDSTWSYGYDLDNRLKTASKTGTAASLAYDAEGRLRQTIIGAGTTNLLYDATDLVAEYDAAGTTLQRRYVHGPGTDEPIVWYEGSGTTAKNWFYADHLGSIVAMANATGTSTGIYSYGPFGEPNTTTGPRFRYTGQQLIGELGLYYYKARFYSPGLGRFLQTDPIGYKDDVNLYAYTRNNPSNAIDPEGTDAIINVDGNNVRITLPITFSGPGATPENIANVTAGIQNQWTGRFGDFNVTTSVIAGAMNNVTLASGPRTAQPFVRMVPGRPGNSGVWQTDIPSLNSWEAAHEAGHLMGLPDRYGGAGTPNPGWNGHLMGEAYGRNLRQSEIADVIRLNPGAATAAPSSVAPAPATHASNSDLYRGSLK